MPILKESIKTALRRRLLFLGWTALAATLIGALGRWHWIAELFSHFTMYYAGFFFIACWVARYRWERGLFIICFLFMMYWAVTPWASFISLSSQKPDASIRIVSYNLLMSNSEKKQESERLQNHDADILFFTEVTPEWGTYLSGLTSLEHCQAYEDSPFGMALFSRLLLEQCEIQYLQASPYIPYIRAVLDGGLVLYGIHLPPPINQELAQERNAMLNELASKIQRETGAVLVLGDMNMTAFSPVFRDFMASTSLHLTAPRGRPTWKPGMIGIDFILASQPNNLISTGTDSWQFSDHKPIWIDYAIKKQPPFMIHPMNKLPLTRASNKNNRNT